MRDNDCNDDLNLCNRFSLQLTLYQRIIRCTNDSWVPRIWGLADDRAMGFPQHSIWKCIFPVLKSNFCAENASKNWWNFLRRGNWFSRISINSNRNIHVICCTHLHHLEYKKKISRHERHRLFNLKILRTFCNLSASDVTLPYFC